MDKVCVGKNKLEILSFCILINKGRAFFYFPLLNNHKKLVRLMYRMLIIDTFTLEL